MLVLLLLVLLMLHLPLVVRALPVGVLSVQTGRPRSFGGDEVELLETIASQVATIVLNARLLDRAFREGDVGEATTIPAPAPAPFPAGTVIRGLATAPVYGGVPTGASGNAAATAPTSFGGHCADGPWEAAYNPPWAT